MRCVDTVLLLNAAIKQQLVVVLLYKGLPILPILQAAAGGLWEAEHTAVKVTGIKVRQLLQHAQHICLCVAACGHGTQRQLMQVWQAVHQQLQGVARDVVYCCADI